MLKKIAAAAALALVASSSFAAAPTAFYGGLDVGSTKIDGFDDNKTSFGGFLGYGFNQFFAVELGYRQLGKWDFGPVELKAKQTHLSVIGSYPLNAQLDVYGRLGYNNLRAEASAGNVTYGDDTDGGLYGIGLNYNFTPQLSGRIEAQKPSSDSTNYSVGVVWKF
jgi:opacity protein-like surface antigen